MGDVIEILTTSTNAVEVIAQGPQGPKGDKGDPGDVAGLPLSVQGDTLYRGASQNERLAIGSTGQVLKVSAQGLPTWANESGAVTSVNGQTGAVVLDAADVGAAETTHAAEHEAGEADEIQAMAALVATEDASLNGIYVPNASGTTSGGRLTLYKPETREKTKLEYNSSLNLWYLIKNTVVQLEGQEVNAVYAWTPQAWIDIRSPQSLPNGGTVTRAGLEMLARRAADGTSNVATATTSFDGLMSSADKTKLNGIAANATANTASSATPSALGTAAAGSASDYARADHTHSAEVSDSAFRVTGSTDATKKVAIEVDTNVPANTTVTLTAPSASGTLALAGAAPAAHAASHAAAGSDPLSPAQIGAMYALETRTNDFYSTSTYVLAQGRNVQLNTRVSAINAIGTITLPRLSVDGSQNGDELVIVGFVEANNGTLIVEKYQWVGSSYINSKITELTTTKNGSWRFRLLDGVWELQPVGTHTHGNITNGGLVGTTSGLPLKTGTGGIVEAGAFGTGAGEFSEGNHTHELTALAATGATNGHVLTANGSNGVTFAALPASGVTGAAASASDVLGVSGANITGVDAGSADRIVFWDDSASKLTYLEAGSGLSISGTTLSATGGLNAMQSIAINFVLN